MGLFKYGPCVNCTGCRWYQPYSKACKQSWENYQDVKIYSKRNLIQDFHISLSEPKRSSQSYLCHTFLNLNIYEISLPIYTHIYIFFSSNSSHWHCISIKWSMDHLLWNSHYIQKVYFITPFEVRLLLCSFMVFSFKTQDFPCYKQNRRALAPLQHQSQDLLKLSFVTVSCNSMAQIR